MGILDKLKDKMKESVTATDKMVDETLPSDEQLQESRKGRRETAEKAAEYLGGKGYPVLGAAAGTAIDMSADLIPESREQYKEDMVSSMAPVGSMGRVGKLAGKMPVKKLTISEVPAGLQQELRASGEKLAEFSANPQKVLDEFLSKEKAARQEAQKAIDLRDLNKGVAKAKPSEEVIEYTTGTQAQERRAMMDPSRRIEVPTKVADVEKGTLSEAVASGTAPTEVRDVTFRTYDGPTHQQQMKLRQEEEFDKMRRQLRKK